jgi:dolichol-phosphate mannosyltransferase
MSKIGVVIPSYNESECIGALVHEIFKHVPNAHITIVDDSPDQKTEAVVLSLKNPSVYLIRRTAKGGRGSAVLEGIKDLLTKGCDPIVEMDADFSHPPAQMPQLLQYFKSNNLDMLIASRYLPASRITNWPISRRIFSKLSNKLARTVLRIPVCDYTNGYRFYSQATAQHIAETCGKHGKGFIALSEILVNVHCAGMKIGEYPTHFVNRVRGESSLNHREITNALTGLVNIYFLKNNLEKEKRQRNELARSYSK